MQTDYLTDSREPELEETLASLVESEYIQPYIEQILAAENDGYIVDLPTGEAFSERTNWQAFTNHWMDMMWHMYRNTNHNVLAVVMRQIDQQDNGADLGIDAYLKLALDCQVTYFAR